MKKFRKLTQLETELVETSYFMKFDDELKVNTKDFDMRKARQAIESLDWYLKVLTPDCIAKKAIKSAKYKIESWSVA